MTERARRENWRDLPPQNWAEREAHRLSLAIYALRKGASAQWLSDRTEALGHRVSRSVISDLETGRRRYVTTAELTVIAAALNTSPVALVYPGPYDQDVELLPGVARREVAAAQWFSGFAYWATDVPEARNDGNVWLRNTQGLRLSRELESAQLARARLLARGQLDLDRDQIAFYDSQIERLAREILLARQDGADA